MGNPKGFTPWNKGLTGIYKEDTKRRIGRAASKRNKGRRLTTLHRKRILLARLALKQCSACSVKSRWIYMVHMPFIEYPLLLCDTDLIDQYHGLSSEDKQKVRIVG